MIDFVKEIREHKAQGATETEILATLIAAYDRDEIDFEELMERVSALNSEYDAQYDVSPLEEVEEAKEAEETPDEMDNLFGMKNDESEIKDEKESLEEKKL